MSHLIEANLIRVFDFYLAVMFLFGLIRRWGVYRDGLLLVIAIRARWPRLLDRLRRHRAVVLNWATLRPLALALGLTVAQMIASRLVWPQATIRVADLAHPWWQLVPFVLALIPMALVDGYFLVRVGRFSRSETEKYFDQAETWAGTWRSRLVRVATLGRVDPDRMVDEQVREGLTQLGATVTWSMWWVSAQIGLRMLFGLTIWLLWAYQL